MAVDFDQISEQRHLLVMTNVHDARGLFDSWISIFHVLGFSSRISSTAASESVSVLYHSSA